MATFAGVVVPADDFAVELDTNRIEQFLADYAAALSAGDLDRIAASWALPAFVLADEGARVVANEAEVRGFFEAAHAWYRSRGLVSVRANMHSEERVSARVSWLAVEWTAFDAEGTPRSTESTRYLVAGDDSGNPQIRVAVFVAEEHGPPGPAAGT